MNANKKTPKKILNKIIPIKADDGATITPADRDAWERMQSEARKRGYTGNNHSRAEGEQFMQEFGFTPDKLTAMQQDYNNTLATDPSRVGADKAQPLKVDGFYGSESSNRRYKHYQLERNGKTQDFGTDADAFYKASQDAGNNNNQQQPTPINNPSSQPMQSPYPNSWRPTSSGLDVQDNVNGLNAAGPQPMKPKTNKSSFYDGPGENDYSIDSVRSNNQVPEMTADPEDNSGSGQDNNGGHSRISGTWDVNHFAHPTFDTANMMAGALSTAAAILPDQHRNDNKQALHMGENRNPYGIAGSSATFELGGDLEAKSGIHIKPQNKGKFTAYKKRTGKTTAEALHSKDAHVRQMANFARNAKKWHHGEDGVDINYYDDSDYEAAQGIRMLGDGNMSSMSDSSNSMFKFNGPSHDEGGIPLMYGKQGAEVQGGETAHISPIDDSLHVHGAMKMPNLGDPTKGLAGRSFQVIGNEIGENQAKASNMGKKAAKIAATVNVRNKFSGFSEGTAVALADGSSQDLRALSIQSEAIANIQEHMRNLAEDKGVDAKKAHTLFGKNGLKMETGGSKKYKADGTIDYGLTPEEEDMAGKIGTNPYIGRLPTSGPNRMSTDPYIPFLDVNSPQMMSTPMTGGYAAKTTQMPQNASPTLPMGEKEHTSLADYNRLTAMDYLPAARYLLETPQSVSTGQINPQLKSPYQVSFQDRMNNNQSTFNQIAKQLGTSGSAGTLGSLAAQKYDADNSVAAEEFRVNQGIANQTSNDNISMMNDAQKANVSLNLDQLDKQARAKSNTEAHKAQALSWIADKVAQNRYENMNIRMLEQRSEYVYNPKTGKMEFQGPNAYLAGTPGGATSGTQNKRTTHYGAEGDITGYDEVNYSDSQDELMRAKALKAQNKAFSSKWGGIFKC